MASERADGAAVRHDEHRLTGVRLGDPLDRGDDSLGQLLARLAVVADLTCAPPREALGESRLHLRPGEARPGADVDLSKPCILDYREPEPIADHPCGLARPLEVARVEGSHPVTCELFREL
jgi:hypothetical protein